jgi:hypothetical protein
MSYQVASNKYARSVIVLRSNVERIITPGQLAVRLKVTSDQAAQALAVLNLAADSPTTREVTTVNGKPVRASR